MKLKYIANILLLVSIVFHFTSCTTQTIPERNLELTAETNALIQLEGINDLALHAADVYVNFLETLKNYDPKDPIFNSPNGIDLEVVIDGVVLKIAKKDRNKYPRNIQIDFGTNGVKLRYGNLYKGKILVNESAAMSDSNATRTYTFSNFFINDLLFKGINTVTYLGQNSDSKPMWKIASKDTLTFQDGRSHYWKADRKRTRINIPTLKKQTDLEEYSIDSIRYNSTEELKILPKVKSMMLWDNLYSVSGFSNGINTSGQTYSTQILESHPLIIGLGFPYYVQGKHVIKIAKDMLIMDFGNQKEDYKVTTTLHGISLEYNSMDQF